MVRRRMVYDIKKCLMGFSWSLLDAIGLDYIYVRYDCARATQAMTPFQRKFPKKSLELAIENFSLSSLER